MVNIGELLGRGEIANLFSETVEEGEVYRLRLFRFQENFQRALCRFVLC